MTGHWVPPLLRGAAVPLALVFAAQIAAVISPLQSDSLASPWDALQAGAHALLDGSLLLATLETLRNAFIGLVIGGSVGLVLGILLGTFWTLNRLLDFTIEALRPIPAVAIIPVALLIFGIGSQMEIAVVAAATPWPVLIMTRAAVAGIEPQLLQVARVLRLGLLSRVFKIILPAALPRIFVAFRLAVGVALTVSVTVEIAANPQGLGQGIMIAQQSLQPGLMIAYLVWIGVVGWSINWLLLQAQQSWFGASRYRRGIIMRVSNVIWNVASLLVGLLLVAGWQAVADARLVSPVFLAGPDRAWDALVQGFESGELMPKLLGTVERMIYGWLLASLLGIAIGTVIGTSNTARAYFQPTLEFLRPLPASAFVPVAIALFGLSEAMALGVVAFGALWPMLLATVHGFAAVEPRLCEVSNVLGMSRLSFIVKIGLPSSMPDILAGMRLSLTISLVLAVLSEMLTGQDGLGTWILQASRSFRAPDLYAGIILLALLGYISAQIIGLAERHATRWRTAHNDV